MTSKFKCGVEQVMAIYPAAITGAIHKRKLRTLQLFYYKPKERAGSGLSATEGENFDSHTLIVNTKVSLVWLNNTYWKVEVFRPDVK